MPAVLEILAEGLAEGVELAALAVVRAAPEDDQRGAWAEAAAALADDPGREAGLRCAALLAVALLCQGGAAVPAAALAALGDDVLLDALIDEGHSAAITGVAAAAGERLAAEERRYLARRLAAAGATGAHVAALHVGLGDVEAAATALAAELEAILEAHAPGDDEPLALAHLALTWSESEGEPFTEALRAALRQPARARMVAALRAAGAGERHPLLLRIMR